MHDHPQDLVTRCNELSRENDHLRRKVDQMHTTIVSLQELAEAKELEDRRVDAMATEAMAAWLKAGNWEGDFPDPPRLMLWLLEERKRMKENIRRVRVRLLWICSLSVVGIAVGVAGVSVGGFSLYQLLWAS